MEMLYSIIVTLIIIDVLSLVFIFIISCFEIFDEAFFINIVVWLVMLLVILAFIYMLVAFRLDKVMFKDKLGGY